MRKEFGRNFEKVATIWRSQKFSKSADSSQDVEGQFQNPVTVVTIFWLLPVPALVAGLKPLTLRWCGKCSTIAGQLEL
jgi:hypothetical protein